MIPAEMATIEDALCRAQSMPNPREVDRDPWTVVLIDFFDDGEASDWVEAQPITMHDLAIMCGDAP
jgi:hypothetical protein